MFKILKAAKNLFFNKEDNNIFAHKSDGDPCAVCKKEMHTKQGITMVGSGEMMHKKCWGKFFSRKIDSMTKAN